MKAIQQSVLLVCLTVLCASEFCPGKSDETRRPDVAHLTNMPNIPPLVLTNDAHVNLWGTEDFLKDSHIWLLGDTNDLKQVLFVLHGNVNEDYSDATAEDRKELHQDLITRKEGAILVYLVCNSSRWRSYCANPMDCSLGLVKAFRQLEKAVGHPLQFQQFTLSGGGRVDRCLLKFLMAKYDHDDTGLDIKQFVNDSMVGLHAGESTYNFFRDEIQIRIGFLERFSHVTASFVHDGDGPEPKEMQKIGEHFAGPSFDVQIEQEMANGRIRFWKGADHFHCWKGHFFRAFGTH